MSDNPFSNPLISVIIAVFNRSESLQHCIDSVAFQTYPNKELIVIDGGSTDGTVDILKSNDEKITYWESEEDRGIYHAFNKALIQAKGDWIYFLGSDDYLWDDQSLSNIAKTLGNIVDPNVRLVYGKVAIVSPNGDVLQVINKPWNQIKNLFLQGCCMCHQGIFQHKSLFEKHGQFDESFLITGDYELLLRELKIKESQPLFIPDVTVAAMQTGGFSSSPQHRISILQEYARARKKNNVLVLFPSVWLWSYVKSLLWLMLVNTFSDKTVNYIADRYRSLTGRVPIWLKISQSENP
jgi:glycosyltransferase involved in cell wall biosynthesis